MKAIYLISAVLLSMFFIGCQDLTRYKAKDIIKNSEKASTLKVSYSIFEYYDFASGVKYSGYRLSYNIEKIRKLEAAGYITISYVMNDSESAIVQFTEKAKDFVKTKTPSPYSQGGNIDLIIGNLDKIKVTGMTKNDDTRYRVEYSSNYKLTPIGEILNDQKYISQNESVVLTKYDDGWRE